MQTIREADFKGKTVLVRADFNVPLENGEILSDFRIRASIPTLEFLRANGAKKIIVISHLGRPDGIDESLSMRPVAARLAELVSAVEFCPALTGSTVSDAVSKLKESGILVLENLRFFAGEEANSEEFIEDIIKSTSADLYVQDGFAVVHRAHASTVAVAKFLPVYAGLLLEKEVSELSSLTHNPKKPLALIIGGSKVEDKAPLIQKFLETSDFIAVGGKIAADGYAGSELKSDKIYVAEDFDEDQEGRKLDIGPVSTVKFAEIIDQSQTIVWNGLLGKAEDPAYSTASTIVAKKLGEKSDAKTVICGGDTTGFVEELMKTDETLKYSLISTGGGAALEFLLGKELPGLSVIK